MDLTFDQKLLLERILLNMRYNTSISLSDNIIYEQPDPKKQSITPYNSPKLDLKFGTDRLNNDEIISMAKKWGWTVPTWIPIAYTDEKKQELKVNDAKSFLKKIGWPKFGIPTKSGIDTKNPEFFKKVQFLNMIKGGLEGGPYGSSDPKLKSGYNECIKSASPEFLPINVIEVYKDIYEFCSVHYKEYAPILKFEYELGHDFLLYVSVISGVLGMIPTPLAPIFNGISIAADLVDAALYFKEGDPYTGTIMAGMALIPGNEFLRTFGAYEYLGKLGKEGYEFLSKKVLKKTASEAEKKTFKKATEELMKKPEVFTKLAKTNLVKKLIQGLKLKPIKFIINFISALGKLGYGIGKVGLTIGGVYYTFDKIYLAVYSNDPKALEVRKYSDIQKLVAFIKNDEEYFKDLMLRETEKALTEAIENGVDLVKIEGTQNPNDLDEYLASIKENESKNNKK